MGRFVSPLDNPANLFMEYICKYNTVLGMHPPPCSLPEPVPAFRPAGQRQEDKGGHRQSIRP